MKDFLTGKWFGTSENLFLQATDYATKTKTPFNVRNFFWDFYKVQKKGTGYVMGTLSKWQKLVPKGEGNLMPFIIRRTKDLRIDVGITRNITFLTPPRELRLQTREGILKNCFYKGKYVLTEADTKQLQVINPGFCFTYLEKFVRLPDTGNNKPIIDYFGQKDTVLLKNTKYNKIPLAEEPFMNFFIQNNEYSKWFKNNYNVLYSTLLVDIPKPLT